MPPCQLHAALRFRELAEQTYSRHSVVVDVPLAHPQHNFQQLQGIQASAAARHPMDAASVRAAAFPPAFDGGALMQLSGLSIQSPPFHEPWPQAARLPQRIREQGRAAVAAYLTERAAAREHVHVEDVLR